MRAMVLDKPGSVEQNPLQLTDVSVPEPAPGELLIRVEVCGVCRTDLHVIEAELPPHRSPVIPGHQVVGRVVGKGPAPAARTGGAAGHPAVGRTPEVGDRVGVAWLHTSCGGCPYCLRGSENLCDTPMFTGYDVNGGFAEYTTAPEAFVYPLPSELPAVEIAPLLCAGIIGYRALTRSDIRPGEPIGLYGFGASAHIVLQIARHWGCPVYVCTRGKAHQELALEMGAAWAGGSDSTPPARLRSAIIFAPAGELVPVALESLAKGGTLVLASIYMTPVPGMDYERHLFHERSVRSVTANTREDGRELLRLAAEIPLRTRTRAFPLEQANEALQALKHDQINGAAVLRVEH